MSTALRVDRDVQVGHCHQFPENRWREAILAFLFGIWSGKPSVWDRPKIIFGGLTLRLDKVEKRYFAYGRGADDYYDMPLTCPTGSEDLTVSDSQQEVEIGLVRFVKDNQIKLFTINLQEGCLVLWKKGKRGEYGCHSTQDVPISHHGLGASVPPVRWC
jgi:hypothetical protein